MTLTIDQEEEFRELLQTCLDNRRKLSRGEGIFIDDQETRYDENQSNINMSPKQWAWLRGIAARYT